MQAGKYTIWRFYTKRVRRIFPALFATILLTWITAYILLLPNLFESFSQSLIGATTFVSNFYFWKDSGYFSASALSRPLLHTWSLAVEEQYYIFAPIFTYIIFKFFNKRWFTAFFPIIVISLTASILATQHAPTANFFLLPTRTWELLLGALLAHRPPPPIKNKTASEALGLIGIALIVYAIFTFTETTPFPGLNAIYPCLGAAILIHIGTQSPTISKFLSLKPMTGIGKISYSLYLIHWPVIVFAYFITLAPPTITQAAIIIAITFTLAIIFYRIIETPFRKLDATAHQKHILLGGLITIIAFSALGALGITSNGFAHRAPDYHHKIIEGNAHWNRGTCFLENNPDHQQWHGAQCNITNDGLPTALLWGDSFAAQYVPGIRKNKDNIPHSILQYTAAGCPPILSYTSIARPKCTDFNANALNIIRKHDIKTVILAGRWTDLESRGLEQLTSTLTALNEIGVKTYIIGQSPQFSIDVQVLAHIKGDKSQSSIDKWDVFFAPEINEKLSSFVKKQHFINPMTALCQGKSCPYRDHTTFLFEDYGHFSVEGSDRAVKAYFPLYHGEERE